MFTRWEIVKVLLTSDYGMIIDIHKKTTEGYVTGYDVRLPDYRVVRFYEDELIQREEVPKCFLPLEDFCKGKIK